MVYGVTLTPNAVGTLCSRQVASRSRGHRVSQILPIVPENANFIP